MKTDAFALRHIGPRESDLPLMLQTIGAASLDQLITETIPDDIRLKSVLDLDEPMTEFEFGQHIHQLGLENKLFKSYIGLGYNQAIVPAVIQRNILENPGWYTAYTPYQAEIAQGRLEAILNFQTMVIELTDCSCRSHGLVV
jgi:glycine dehydrogenase